MKRNSIIRLKFLFEKRIGGSWGDEPTDGNSFVCIRAADFDTYSLTHKTSDLTRRSFKEEELKSKVLRKGDLIIEKSGGGENQPVGRVVKFNLAEKALCSNFLEVLRPNSRKIDSQYAAYLLYSLWNSREVIKSIKQTTGIQNLDLTEYLDNKVNLPEVAQQKKIVKTLQAELNDLDNLFRTKIDFAKKLDEKRQALIIQAITKGLDTKVKMKRSHIPWLEEIPDHWERKKIKFIATLKSGEFITAESINQFDQYPVYGGNGLRGYTYSKTHSGNYILIGRQGALCGNINYASGDFFASEHAIVCIPLVDYDTTWFGEMLKIMNLNQYSAAAAQPGLSVEVVKNLDIPYPPRNEQAEISNFIIKETQRIDGLLSSIYKSSKLISERKMALINKSLNME